MASLPRQIDLSKSRRTSMVSDKGDDSWLERSDRWTNDYLILVPEIGLTLAPLMYALAQFRDGFFFSAAVATGLFLLFGLFTLTTAKKIATSRRLQRIDTDLPPEIVQSVLEATFEQQQWSVVTNAKNHAIVHTQSSLFTWGQEVTVIHGKGHVLVNSRNRESPIFFLGRSPYSFGRNRHNVEVIRAALEQAAKNAI